MFAEPVGWRRWLAIAAGFGRAISEVGASLMVGANIAGETRVLTTAITLESSRGEFSLAIALGLVLLVVALIANTARLLIEPAGTLLVPPSCLASPAIS
mgnify:CR=1 FL=1